jgi:hypothetical protein
MDEESAVRAGAHTAFQRLSSVVLGVAAGLRGRISSLGVPNPESLVARLAFTGPPDRRAVDRSIAATASIICSVVTGGRAILIASANASLQA